MIVISISIPISISIFEKFQRIHEISNIYVYMYLVIS